jgi:hypothetical protein
VDRDIYSESMAEVLKRDSTFLERSLYFSQISRYLDFFARDQFLILFFEEFIANPVATLIDIFDFLGIDADPVSSVNTKRRNKTIVSPAVRRRNSHFDKASYDLLIQPIQDDVNSLKRFVGRDTIDWDLSEGRWCNPA